MKIEITGKGIYGAKGEVQIGTTLEVKEEPKGWAGRYRVVSGGSTEGKTPVTNPATDYVVAESSPGWFVVTKDGQPVTKKLRQSDLEGFDTMSDEDKAAFADLHKVEA
jgi:hypothetical protein